MAKRAYGTGSLVAERGAWYGRWRDGSGHQYKRRLGKRRAPGERDGLTKSQAEAKLRELIQAEQAFRAAKTENAPAVANMRHLLQETMQRDFNAAIERLSGRKVVAFISGNHVDPDMAAEVFVLDDDI